MVVDAVRRNREFRHTPATLIHEAIKQWLKCAGDRDGGRLLRAAMTHQHRASRHNSSSRGSHSFAVRGGSSGARRHKTHRRASTPVDLGRSPTPDRRRSSGGPSESGAGRQKTHGRTSTPVDHARSTTPEHLLDNGDVSSESDD